MKTKTYYLAGPYTANKAVNTAKMVDVYNELIIRGYKVYCPLLSHFADERFKATNGGLAIHYELWMELDLHFLELCDVLVWLGSSPGADRERERAEELGLEIVEEWQTLCT